MVNTNETNADSKDGTAPEKSAAWRIVALIEALVDAPNGIGVRETARSIGIDKSSVNRLLTQLQELGFVNQDVLGRYSVGPRLFAVGAALVARDSFAVAARPILTELVDRFNETTYLAVRETGGFIYRAKMECTRPIRYVIELGHMNPLHAGAPARAILFGMTDEELEATLDGLNLEAFTEKTITSRAALIEGVKVDRARGFSFTKSERMIGGTAVAAPFYDPLGVCRGSIVISRPLERHLDSELPEMAAAVMDAAARLTDRFGGHAPSSPPGALTAPNPLERHVRRKAEGSG